MQPLQQAFLVVNWSDQIEFIAVQFNPTEISFNKGVQIAEIAIPGLDSPLLQFVRGQDETITMDLFFDTTENGMGVGAKSVTALTDQIYSLVKIDPNRHAPPICTFLWNSKFPGCDISSSLGNQKRSEFQCLVESVRHKYTLFSPEGVPLRATVSVTLREYKTIDDQFAQLNLNSPDRTQVHILQQGETLSSVAGEHYDRPGNWRLIAQASGVEDPRRIDPGMFLTVPPAQ
jgi:nucleoid-associated protein YgaU